MSLSIPQSFIKNFEALVHVNYQQMGSKLRPTVRTKDNVVGASTTFQRVGKGTASTKARHGKVPVMNVEHAGRVRVAGLLRRRLDRQARRAHP